MYFLELGNPDTYMGFPSSKSSNITGKCMRFCVKQRGLALLLDIKSHACTCDTTGLRAGESL